MFATRITLAGTFAVLIIAALCHTTAHALPSGQKPLGIANIRPRDEGPSVPVTADVVPGSEQVEETFTPQQLKADVSHTGKLLPMGKPASRQPVRLGMLSVNKNAEEGGAAEESVEVSSSQFKHDQPERTPLPEDVRNKRDALVDEIRERDFDYSEHRAKQKREQQLLDLNHQEEDAKERHKQIQKAFDDKYKSVLQELSHQRKQIDEEYKAAIYQLKVDRQQAATLRNLKSLMHDARSQ